MKQVRSLHIKTDSLLNQPFRIALLLNSKLAVHCRIVRGFIDWMNEHRLKWAISIGSFYEIQ